MSIIICCYILIQTKACRSDIRRKKVIKSQVLDEASEIKKKELLYIISLPRMFDQC